jgi:hypothetical protein
MMMPPAGEQLQGKLIDTGAVFESVLQAYIRSRAQFQLVNEKP